MKKGHLNWNVLSVFLFVAMVSQGCDKTVVGMIIAVPIYTVIKVVLKEFTSEIRIFNALTKDM